MADKIIPIILAAVIDSFKSVMPTIAAKTPLKDTVGKTLDISPLLKAIFRQTIEKAHNKPPIKPQREKLNFPLKNTIGNKNMAANNPTKKTVKKASTFPAANFKTTLSNPIDTSDIKL